MLKSLAMFGLGSEIHGVDFLVGVVFFRFVFRHSSNREGQLTVLPSSM